MSKRGDLGQALETCLEAMREDGVGPDAALAQVPDAPESLAELVHMAAGLRALGPQVEPSASFRADLAAVLTAAPPPSSLVATAAIRPVPTTQLVHDLDTALEAMRAEGATPQSVLAEYGDTAAELTPLVTLAEALVQLPQPAVPSAAFQRRLAARLAAAPPPSSLSRRSTWGAGLARLRRSAAVAAALAAALVVFTATGVGLASANALPGQPLYPVKRVLEQGRLWMLSGELEMVFHLDLASRRLAEAMAAPPWADRALAEFSAEITAALGVADRSLAHGAAQQRIAPALVARLLTSRAELTSAGPHLPPTAWRSALALVDTAIALWHGGELSAVPVPRLFGPASGGARGGVAVLPPLAPALVDSPRLAAGTGAGSGIVVESGGPPPPQAGTQGLAAPLAGRPGSPEAGASTHLNPEPRPTEARPTATRTPLPPPTATGTPPGPTAEPPVTETATVRPPITTSPPPETPTAPISPTPSATPDKLPPVIVSLSQDVMMVPLGGVASFEVTAYDPDGGPLTYKWQADWGQMLEGHQPAARFYALGNLSGMGLVVTVTVLVTDQTGAWAQGEAFIEVVPRVEGPR